jgi:Raf kinase inhibitor-like YbhB/YbcL family protein
LACSFRAAVRLGGRILAALLIVPSLATVLAGCGLLSGLSGRRPVSAQVMTVTSPVFGDHLLIPRRYTCHGVGQRPPLYWSGAPQDARSFAIVIDDSLAPIAPKVYWLVFDVSPATTELLPGQLPAGARQAQNSAGVAGYAPVCPVRGPHAYRFTVYALDVVLQVPRNAQLRQAWRAIAAHVIAVGRLTARAIP